MKKLLAIMIIFLFFGMIIFPSMGIQIENKTVIQTSRGNTLHVGGNGSGNYTKIQDAIDNAIDGDTVYVYDDSSPYYENVVIDKSINLIGEDVKESSKKIIILYPDDTEITHNSPNINYGENLEIGIRNEYGVGGTSGWACDGLIKFDLSKLPAGSTIKSAKLYLYYYRWQDNSPAGRKLNLYRITSDWNENTVTWNIAPSYNQTPTANSSVPSAVNIWMEWDVKSDVKDFISGTPNYGWRLIDDDYWGLPNIPLICFRTKEFSNNLSSYLEIEYTTSRNKIVNLPRLEYLKQIKDIISYDKETSDSEEDCECQSNGLKYKDYKNCSIRAKEGVDGKAFLFPGFFSSWPGSDSTGIDVERAFGILIREHVICPCYGIYFNNDYYYSNWTKAYVFSFTGYFYNYFYGPWRIFEIDGIAKFVRVYYS